MASRDSKVKKAEIFSLCLCPTCPSWVSCREKGGFCLPDVGRSKCIAEEKGCICGACRVTKMFALKHGYYCTRGSEKEQSGK
ncbi:DUF2769 domain-containing protein [Candidatus Micrarchaeota archaeon]|nr:DUF2769 domain-containing protein [Candidatus Micrarchaeota archaeon]